ncbi:MAG: hypothetical protein LWY06_19720 [Firmicutes bacterium]|nr:hypothetical protein [Bacillota bacterium]
MKVSRYLFAILVIFFLTLAFAYTRVGTQTFRYEKDLKEAYKRAGTGRNLQYLKVMDYKVQSGTASVFAVESTEGSEANQPSYETGRMMKFIKDEKTGIWRTDKKTDTVFWDSRKNSGNQFTFPPFTGKDITILLKK